MKHLLLIALLASGCSAPKVRVLLHGDRDRVYNVYVATYVTHTNWVLATNFIGNGTNGFPEVIELPLRKGATLYKIETE